MHGPWTPGRTDITGATGLAISRARVAGEREPVQRARLRAPRGARRPEESAKALTGQDQLAPVLGLTPALARDDASTAQVRQCAGEIARRCQALTPVWSAALLPRDRADTPTTHHTPAPPDEARRRRSQWVGVDLSAIPGRPASPGHTMLAAIGLDRHQWPSRQAVCAWCGVAPRHQLSGAKVWRRSPLKTGNRAGPACRLAAPAIRRRHNRLGAYDRRRRARLGPKTAIVATAHTRARLVSHRLTHPTPDRDRSAEDDAQQARQREIVSRRTTAATLGLALVESPA